MNYCWLTLVFTFTLVWSQFVQAAPAKIKESLLPNGLKVSEYRLANGLQILLVPDAYAPVVDFQLWFRVGSAAERLDPNLKKTGLAHLFEHMMFRGTPKNPDQVFDKKLTEAGAVGMNATTWLDRTNYFQSVPKEKLELVFELESDRMVNLKINEKLFQTEIGAVVGEKKMRDDKPGSLAYESLWNLAFEASPYRWSVIGTLEEIKGFTVENANYFYRTYYAPNNATLILLGDFDQANALQLAEKYFGKMSAQKIPDFANFQEPEQKKAKVFSVEHPLAVSDIVMLGYKIPEITHPDMAALDVLAGILAYGNSSWLEQELQQTGKVTGVSASVSKAKFPGLFIASLQMAKGKSTAEAIEITKNAIERIKAGKFTDKDLERAKNQYLLYSYQELASLTQVGKNLGDALASSGDYLRDFAILEDVKKVTAAEIRRVANLYFQDHLVTQLIVTPPQKEQK
jgi:zinc protease